MCLIGSMCLIEKWGLTMPIVTTGKCLVKSSRYMLKIELKGIPGESWYDMEGGATLLHGSVILGHHIWCSPCSSTSKHWVWTRVCSSFIEASLWICCKLIEDYDRVAIVDRRRESEVFLLSSFVSSWFKRGGVAYHHVHLVHALN